MSGTNNVAIVVGPRGCGKSTAARKLARDALDAGRWVFAHDPVAQYRGLCVTYTSVADWAAAMVVAASTNQPLARGAAFAIGAPLELVDLVLELGEEHNTAARERFPMTLCFDESAFLAQGTHVDAKMNELLALARHRGVQLVFVVQRRSQLSVPFWEMATDVLIFRQPAGRTEEIEAPLSLPRGSLARTTELEPFTFVHVRSGVGPQ